MTERILVFDQQPNLWAACEQFVQESVGLVTRQGQRAGLLVAGGTTLLPFYEHATDPTADIFPADERMVPIGHPADTGSMLQREWLGRLLVSHSRVVAVQRAQDAAATAALYEQVLYNWTNDGGTWAAAVLGVGTDGHVASLFPGQAEGWLKTGQWVIPADAEQEPRVARITTTPAFLATLPRHIIVLCGSAKTEIATRWLREREDLPCEIIQSTVDRIVLLDRNAARNLDPKHYEFY